uniref:RNase H type-1 domain-containing protein n=1 Tax=Cannabis sativa TaxID=3483 RepID=A0A803PK99_CANSA
MLRIVKRKSSHVTKVDRFRVLFFNSSFVELSCGLNNIPIGNSHNASLITEKCITTSTPSSSSVKKVPLPQCSQMNSMPESSGVKRFSSTATDLTPTKISSKATITHPQMVVLSSATPPAYFHLSDHHLSGSTMMTMPIPSASNTFASSTTTAVLDPSSARIIHQTEVSPTAENRMASLFSKRQFVSSSGNVRQVLKRCHTRNAPFTNVTNITVSSFNLDSNSVSSNNSLKRHIPGSSTCPLCRDNNETICHALFLCKRAKKVWRGSSFSMDRLLAESSNFKDLFFKASETWSQHDLEQFACLLWCIWTERNKENHGTKAKPHEVLLFSALTYLGEYQAARKAPPSNLSHEVLNNTVPTVTPRWLNPPSGRLKLNTDAAVDVVNRISGFGAILRDSNGQVVAAMSRPYPSCFKPKVMEALALRFSLQWLQEMNIPIHYIETDSLLVVKGLHSKNFNVSDFQSVLHDISILMSNFPGMQISHVFQSANTFAHALAKYALSVDKECVWLEKFPPPLMTIVL